MVGIGPRASELHPPVYGNLGHRIEVVVHVVEVELKKTYDLKEHMLDKSVKRVFRAEGSRD